MQYSRYELLLFGSVLAVMLYVVFFRFGPDFNPSRVKPSWLGLRDAHDIQWEVYRSTLPLTLLLGLLWVAVGRCLLKAKLNNKRFSWTLGSAILCYVFRGDVLLYLGLVSAYYLMVRALAGTRVFLPVLWTVAVGNLLAMEYFKRTRDVSNFLEQMVFGDGFMANSKHVIHWSSLFNMTLLRIISFGADYHRKLTRSQDASHFAKCQVCCRERLCIRGAECTSARQFGWLSLINYLLYPPILLAGPPMSYNNFMVVCEAEPAWPSAPALQGKAVALHWLRTGADFLAFELFQHFMKAGALIREPELWQSFGLIKTEALSLFSVAFIWFKFLVIWRVARGLALLDGYEVYENMNRCVFNNYSIEGFWRAWHRGFNQWLIRYMFVPLGGSARKLLVIWPIFAFVALWHDANPRLVIWAWLCCLTMMPELLLRTLFKGSPIQSTRWYAYLSALGGALVVKCLVLLNMIGFALGGGVSRYLWEKVGWAGAGEWLVSLLLVSCVVHLMFHVRAGESSTKGY